MPKKIFKVNNAHQKNVENYKMRILEIACRDLSIFIYNTLEL